METYDKQLFDELVNLTETNEAFYKQQFASNNHIYWIFNYRLASYSDFLLPSALECRGIMFEVDEQGNMLELKSRPMEKFFNLNENPMTIGLDLSQVQQIFDKVDGSLISTYIEDSLLKLKSKGSIASEQCLAAMEWLSNDPDFLQKLLVFEQQGFTVNLEWCSPEHRIVIGYDKPQLIVLNARHRHSPFYYFTEHEDLVKIFGDEFVVKNKPVENVVEFVNNIPQMNDNIEGYVCVLKSGQRFKVKTNKYVSLHHAKDAVNNPRRLYEAVLNEGTDDLRAMFCSDPVVIQSIQQMEDLVSHIYNHFVNVVETFYETNKHLSRKEYAILGTSTLKPIEFKMAIEKYLQRNTDYKSYLLSKWKDLGFKDMIKDQNNE